MTKILTQMCDPICEGTNRDAKSPETEPPETDKFKEPTSRNQLQGATPRNQAGHASVRHRPPKTDKSREPNSGEPH